MSSISFLAPSTIGLHPSSGTRKWFVRIATVLVGTSLLWASAKVQLPFWPVPMTMQTYVVLTMGALLGWRLGGATLAAYLAEGASGLPVFAGTPANGIGLAYMVGSTGGYLAGYLVAVVLVGLWAERCRNRTIVNTAAAMLVGELVILSLGCCWLAVQFDWHRAFAFGVGPFLFGDGLKIVLAIGTVVYGPQLCEKRHAPRFH